MEIMEILSHIFDKNFRESNSFTKEVPKELISRNMFSVIRFFVFPYCLIMFAFTECKKEILSRFFMGS